MQACLPLARMRRDGAGHAAPRRRCATPRCSHLQTQPTARYSSPSRASRGSDRSSGRLPAMFALGGLGSCVASAAAACACSCCTSVTQQALRSSARAAWSLLFTFSIVAAWLARDFGAALLKKLPCERPGLPGRRPSADTRWGRASAAALGARAIDASPMPRLCLARLLAGIPRSKTLRRVCLRRGGAPLCGRAAARRRLVWAAGRVPHLAGQLCALRRPGRHNG